MGTTETEPSHEDRARIEREAAGARIDPRTAEVWFEYGRIIDPYGDGGFPPEFDNIGRVWFAADPVERFAVHFDDLPAATRHALWDKRLVEDRKGWEMLLRIMHGSEEVDR